MRGHAPSHFILWAGAVALLASSVPSMAADSFCIPELTVARQPPVPRHTTPEVELRVHGTWTCSGDLPVLGEVTRAGNTTRVVLAADATSAGPGSGQRFELATSLGPLPPGENLVEIYLEDGGETRFLALERFEVGLECFRSLDFSVGPILRRPGDVVSVGVQGFLCSGSISLDDVEVVGKTIRLKARAMFSGPSAESYFTLRGEAGVLEAGRYTLEFLVDTTEATWAGYQRVASETRHLYGFCEPDPGRTSRADGPGATLLVPYFEVDLENADGPNTLFSVGNASAEAVLVNVVLWTDWGIPSYAFPLYLLADEVRPIDLRTLFAGRVPESGLGAAAAALPPGCEDPLAVAPLDRARLRAMHTGQPRPGDGLCAGGLHFLTTDVAYGYVTVDAVHSCSSGGVEDGIAVAPGDEGYFAPQGNGRASDRNVLWGDVFYVRPAEDSAQAIAAVAIPAEPERFTGPGPHVTFYRDLVGGDGSDGRVPLASSSQMRLVDGGGLDMRTELLVWTEGLGPSPPVPCGTWPFGGIPIDDTPTAPYGLLIFEVTSQRGNELRERSGLGMPWRSQRLDARDFVSVTPFGQLIVEGVRSDGSSDEEPVQTLVIPLLSADGRFSLAYEATPLDAACRW